MKKKPQDNVKRDIIGTLIMTLIVAILILIGLLFRGNLDLLTYFLVNGNVTFTENECTGALPGKLLRSSRMAT